MHTTRALALLAALAATMVTMWSEANFAGTQDVISDEFVDQCSPISTQLQDQVSSLAVEPGFSCTFFRDFDCLGPQTTFPQQGFSNRVPALGADNDSYSSFQCKRV